MGRKYAGNAAARQLALRGASVALTTSFFEVNAAACRCLAKWPRIIRRRQRKRARHLGRRKLNRRVTHRARDWWAGLWPRATSPVRAASASGPDAHKGRPSGRPLYPYSEDARLRSPFTSCCVYLWIMMFPPPRTVVGFASSDALSMLSYTRPDGPQILMRNLSVPPPPATSPAIAVSMKL